MVDLSESCGNSSDQTVTLEGRGHLMYGCLVVECDPGIALVWMTGYLWGGLSLWWRLHEPFWSGGYLPVILRSSALVSFISGFKLRKASQFTRKIVLRLHTIYQFLCEHLNYLSCIYNNIVTYLVTFITFMKLNLYILWVLIYSIYCNHRLSCLTGVQLQANWESVGEKKKKDIVKMRKCPTGSKGPSEAIILWNNSF